MISELTPKKKNKQKSNQDIFEHLLELYKPLQNKISQRHVILQVQDIYEMIQNHPRARNQRTLKKIKSQLHEMKCFKTAPINQSNPQFHEIFKRDNTNILNMISPFIQMTKYQKGSIAEATGFQRNSIKILLFGQVHMFESLNYRTFKNCQLKIKNGQINTQILEHSKQMLNQIFLPAKQENPEQIFSKQESTSKFITQLSQEKIKTNQDHPENFLRNQNEVLINEENPQNLIIGQVLTRNQCRIILNKCGLISPITPHKNGKQIELGDYLFDKEQPLFIDQKPQYYSSVVCATDCFFLQIGYEIAKQVIQLINSDRQRPYIQSLLFKFPMLKYFQAKQYVTPQFMIAQEVQQQQGVKVTKKLAIQIVKELKIVSSLNFQLSFTGDLYLIISGQVTLVIDQISQKKSSAIQYARAQKNAINKQILHLYKNDIFGFEQIGLNKEVNLRYLATIGSKLLKINKNMFKHHLQTIPGFKKEIEKLKMIRNEIIIQILQKMQEILQGEQLKRHQSITYSKSENKLAKIKSTKSTQLTNETKQIMELRYYGRQKFNEVSNRIKKHFSPENTDIPKQGLSPQIVKQNGLGIQFAQNLLKRPSQRIEIKDGWIQIRNNKGTLLRKKKVKQSDKSVNVERGDALLRRLGILSSQEIADHNHEIVKKRPSKYQFRDLQKEAKQFRQIKHKVESLPKLTNFFAKKQNRVFQIIYKRTHF